MAGTAGAIRAGRAFVELFTDSSRMTRGLKKAEGDFKGWGSRLSGFGKRMSLGGTVGDLAGKVTEFATSPGGILTGMGLAAKSFADAGSELNDMSARTGASVESLSLLKFAAEQTGTDFAAVGIGVKGLDNKLSDAVGGSKEAEAAFGKLGLSSQQLLGMSVEDQMAAIADGLMKIQNPALRAAAAEDIFGKSGSALLPMLKDGAAGLKALTERGKEVGAGWTTDAANSADALGDRFDELKVTSLSVVYAVGGALAPAIMELSEPIFAIAAATREWIAANPGVITTVATVAAGAVAAGVAITGLGLTITAIGAGLGGLGAAAAAVVSPIGAVVAALTGIGYLIVTETDIGSDAFASLSQTATTAWGGISDAMAAGDIGLAAEIAVAGLNVVWQQGVAVLLDTWTVTSTAIMQSWNDVTSAMMGVGEEFNAWYSTIWVDIKGFAFDALNSIASKWDSVTGGIADVLIDVGVSSGVISGDAEEIKATRREDTARRQTVRDDAVAAGMKSRDKEKADIAENKQAGLGGIEVERAKKEQSLTNEQNAALMANEKAKAKAQEKLAELRKTAADEKKIADEFGELGLGGKDNFKDQKEQLAYLKAMGFDLPAGNATDPDANVGGTRLGVKGAATFSGLASSMNRDYGTFANVKTPATADIFGGGAAPGAGAETEVGDTELLTSIRDTLQSLDGRVAAGGTMTA